MMKFSIRQINTVILYTKMLKLNQKDKFRNRFVELNIDLEVPKLLEILSTSG